MLCVRLIDAMAMAWRSVGEVKLLFNASARIGRQLQDRDRVATDVRSLLSLEIFKVVARMRSREPCDAQLTADLIQLNESSTTQQRSLGIFDIAHLSKD